MTKMLFMLFIVLQKNQNVIKEDKNKIIKLFFEEICHKTIEGCGSIRQSKRYDSEFIVSEPGIEGCLGNILIFYSNLVVPRFEIYL